MLLDYLAGQLPLTAADVTLLQRTATPARLSRGEALHVAGRPLARLLVLREGLVRAYYLHGDREVNLRLLADMSVVLPLAALITGEAAGEHIQALADGDGWWLPASLLAEGGLSPPARERARRLLAEQHYLAMEQRLRMLQHKSAAERWQDFRARMPARIVRETPGYHVASYLGITPESLSRVRRGA